MYIWKSIFKQILVSAELRLHTCTNFLPFFVQYFESIWGDFLNQNSEHISPILSGLMSRMVVWWLLFDRIFCKRNKVGSWIGFYFIFHFALALRICWNNSGVVHKLCWQDFGFLWPPTPLRWHFLHYECWQKANIFGLPTPPLLF